MDIPVIYSNYNNISLKAVDIFLNRYEEEIKKKGIFSVILSGGKSPVKFYEYLSQRNIDFSKIIFFFADERCVDKESSESNFKMVNDMLFSKIKIPAENIKRIEVEKKDAEKLYDGEIKKYLSEYNLFDFAVLGIGKDGHTASLFKTNYTTDEYVIRTKATGYSVEDRISLNFNVLNRVKTVIFLVSGKDKNEVVYDIVNAKKEYPATKIKTEEIYYMIDSDSIELIIDEKK